jgi:fermentation-respiration switch protein FrsA (DUF1100 family)
VRFAGSDGVTLVGTLLLPAWSELQRVPGIVLVAGSGPTDRDGNNPLVPQHIDVLKLIAELLAAAGIATLRYDKRGIGGSTARPHGTLAEQERFFSWDNFVGDVAAAHGELVKHDEIKAYATALLGHSEGGLLVLAALPAITKNRPHGMVLASTPGRPMREIVREQVNRGAPNLVDAVTATMAAIEASGHVPADLPLELQALFPAYAGPYLQRMLAFDPAQALLGLDLACLLLQGAADRQVVPMGDVQPLIDALSKRSAPGEAVVIPAVSHNLKLVSWPGDTGFGGPIAPAIATKLVDWLVPMLGA